MKKEGKWCIIEPIKTQGGIAYFAGSVLLCDPRGRFRGENMKDDLSAYLFHQGTNYKAYEYFGAHIAESDGVAGVMFRVCRDFRFRRR